MFKIKIIRSSTISASLYALLKGQLEYLNQHYEVIAVSGYDEYLEIVAKREGVKIKDIPIQRQISPIKDLLSLVKLYRYFKKEKPLIVHSITPKAGLLCMTAAYFAGVPIRMHTFTGLIFPSRTGIFRVLLLNMDRILCFFATNIYPEGQGVKQDLITNHVTRKPLKVLANGNINGLDGQFFAPESVSAAEKESLRRMLKLKKEDFIFLFIGRLVGDKGINDLIEAFCQLVNQTDVPVKLLLVGPFEEDQDPLKPETMKTIMEHPQLIHVGFQPDVRPYLAISDVFVFPSYREGFPNTVMQAGAMGLPSIVTDINGSNEIIQHNVNGIIVPVKNPLALQAAMQLLLSDKNKREQLKSLSRIIILEKYEQKKVWEALLAEYKSLSDV